MSTRIPRLIILDLECTCWERNPPTQHETIEIGAVVWEHPGGILDSFDSFVRPKLGPELSPFCTELTSIRQADVENARPFESVLSDFKAWCDKYWRYTLASWGDFDRKQLIQDCKLHGIKYPFKRHLNLKTVFAVTMHCRPQGMAAALSRVGMSLDGTHHRAIDDVRNTARIIDWMVRKDMTSVAKAMVKATRK